MRLDGLERNGDAVAKVTARFTDDACIVDSGAEDQGSMDFDEGCACHVAK